jgi:hypothetical protein
MQVSKLHSRCSKCSAHKLVTEFYTSKMTRSGLSSWCKLCTKTERKENYHKNRDVMRERERQRYYQNRTEILARQRKDRPNWTPEQKERHRAQNWKSTLRVKYKLSPDAWQTMCDRQAGKCSICGGVPRTMKYHDVRGTSLMIDHHHESGAVRELLCVRCNTLVGYLEVDPALIDRAAAYIRRHNHVIAITT